MKEVVLDLSALSVDFKTDDGIKKGIESISFQINRGEITGLVGESGSGKSVTSLAIMGLLSNNAVIKKGTAHFTKRSGEKVDLLQLKATEKRKLLGSEIAMVFQEPMTALNPVQKCGKQLIENIYLHSENSPEKAKVVAEQLLKEVNLTDTQRIFHSYPHQISGGQRQRVMIAMALAGNPSLLIADEPTTALDVIVQKEITQLLSDLCKQRNMSMLFISHDLNLVSKICNQTIVMYKGNIIEYGYSEQIFNDPQNPYTKGLLACRPNANSNDYYLPTLSSFIENKEYTAQPLPKRVIEKQTLATISHVGKTYKNGYVALEDISFELQKGETLGLAGESGSGKSTLSKIITKLETKTSGTIIYQGQSLQKVSNYPKLVQMIFQDPFSSLNPSITIGDAISEPIKIHKIGNSKELTKEWLERVGLSATDYHKYPAEFSGGQRQRICIARALATKPELVLCDESVSALDLSVQAQILNLLKKLQFEEKLTYLFITHDMQVMRYMTDRIMVLQKGKIVEEGSTEKVFQNPQHPYTQLLINESGSC